MTCPSQQPQLCGAHQQLFAGHDPGAAWSERVEALSAEEAKKLIIGFTASQTGAQNVASNKQNEGLQLWLDDVKKAGGLKLKDGTVLMPKIVS